MVFWIVLLRWENNGFSAAEVTYLRSIGSISGLIKRNTRLTSTSVPDAALRVAIRGKASALAGDTGYIIVAYIII
jgi:hypothetical protein